MELEEIVLTRQAGQRIGPRDRSKPQHHMLPGLVTHRPLGAQAQAQHIAEPIQRTDLGRHAILLRVEQRHTQVLDHPTLARQTPPLGMLVQRQGLGPGIQRLTIQAMYQAGMAAAGAATVRHVQPCPVQGIEQVAAGRHRPAALAHVKFGHD